MLRKLFLLLVSITILSCYQQEKSEIAFDGTLQWSKIAELPDQYGRAGAYVGHHNGVIIFAGGANFEEFEWSATSKKKYYDDYFIFEVATKTWIETDVKLPRPMGYGSSVQTAEGVYFFGGTDDKVVYDDSFIVSWDSAKKKLTVKDLETMPTPLAFMQAVALGSKIYFAGGKTGPSTATTMTNAFLCYETKNDKIESKSSWVVTKTNYNNETLNGVFPAPERILPFMVTQSNGDHDCLYLFGGRQELPENKFVYFKDTWEFDPIKNAWTKKSDCPVTLQAGEAIPIGIGHIFTLSGTNGDLITKVVNGEITQAEHPGFEKDSYAYFTINDTWVKAQPLPVNQLTTPISRGGLSRTAPAYIVSGEIKPKIRTADVWEIKAVKSSVDFGIINFSIIGIYLLGLIGVGIFFSFRNKNTEDFFKASGRIPFWVAAMSIFATMLSSITFIAVPGKAFATNWVNFLLQISMFAVTPIVVMLFLPYFRKITSASAYEYLETRFNTATRLFASGSFILYHIGRMGLVMYLPALALSTILNISPNPQTNQMICILIMGFLSVVYCTLGGLEAVVWTDTIQGIILILGAIVTIFTILFEVGGIDTFLNISIADQKFKMVDWDWSLNSYMIPCLWVILIGGFGQNLIPYSSDMAIIQRYMSVKDEKSAKKSIWTNTFISVFASALFFLVGTALYVFYKEFPFRLDPVVDKIDYTFPVFIVKELPVGIAGIVVAAIFSAAQSTVSTSINSATAAIMSDFVARFKWITGEKKELTLSRIITFVFGTIGTLTGIIFIFVSNQSLWDQFMIILGLVGGAMCGLFCLGIFTKRGNGAGALIGATTGVIVTLVISTYTPVHGYLYGIINVVVTYVVGYLSSLIFKNSNKKIA